MIVRTLLALACSGVVLAASAQSATAPAGGKPSAHSCPKPGEHPGRLAADANRRKWVNDANAYLECLKKYIGEQTSSYNQLVEQAKPYAEAANKAAEEYNGAVKSLKEEADRNN